MITMKGEERKQPGAAQEVRGVSVGFWRYTHHAHHAHGAAAASVGVLLSTNEGGEAAA